MILSDIKGYLQAHGQATLKDIALHFDASPEAVRGMLEHWIRKGRVEKQLLNDACQSACTQCDPGDTEIYLWRDAPGQPGEPVRPYGPGCPGS